MTSRLRRREAGTDCRAEQLRLAHAGVEAGRIYVHFGTYGTACLDTATGKTIWSRHDLHCNHFRGPARRPSSTMTAHPQFDGTDVQYVVALDNGPARPSGRPTARPITAAPTVTIARPIRRRSSSTPAGRIDQLRGLRRRGLRPESGHEIWKVDYPGGFSNIGRPLYGQGCCFSTRALAGRGDLAVRPDGHGDITASHVVWK